MTGRTVIQAEGNLRSIRGFKASNSGEVILTLTNPVSKGDPLTELVGHLVACQFRIGWKLTSAVVGRLGAVPMAGSAVYFMERKA